jgi:hypothetical protein
MAPARPLPASYALASIMLLLTHACSALPEAAGTKNAESPYGPQEGHQQHGGYDCAVCSACFAKSATVRAKEREWSALFQIKGQVSTPETPNPTLNP